jgi:D-alanine-D-alanine ligase
MRLRVAVIYGGRSGEHEVSIRSAEAVMAALDPGKYDTVRFFIDPEGKWNPGPILPEPGANAGIDVVFPVLHGTYGEDGTMQGLFELAGLPYVGAGVLGSALAMDKDAMKRVARERGLPVVDWVTVMRSCLDPDDILRRIDLPVFVKPANLGSSVGISKARTRDELRTALDTAAEFDRKIIVERAIDGRELECAVLGNDVPAASLPCEVLPSRDFYDYEDKYLLDSARFEVPADLTPDQTAEVRRLAIECYRAVECEGMARVDFFLEKSTGRIYINEINTIPGFTSISMFPRMWAADGLAFPQLIERLLALALERHQAREATRYRR